MPPGLPGPPPEPGVEPPAAQSVSAGVVELRQNPDGHFYIEGSINGAPLRFLIDTGASITMLTKEAAAQVDLSECRAGKSSTANGVVDVCVGVVPEMRIGPYRVNDSLAAELGLALSALLALVAPPGFGESVPSAFATPRAMAEEPALRKVLERYAQAIDNKDLAALRSVKPTLSAESALQGRPAS